MKQRLTGFAQAGGVNAHGHRLAQDVEQNHRAAFGIRVLVDGFKPGKRAIGDGDVVAFREKGLWRSILFTRADQINQLAVHLGGLTTKPNQLVHAHRRANRRPALAGATGVQTNEPKKAVEVSFSLN